MTNADAGETNPAQKPRAGRPRSAESRRAIIQSAMHILQDDGYAALNIEAIAAKAGVSKQTIYRWWPSAAFIVLEALTADMQAQDAPMPDTGSLKGDLLELVRPTVRALAQRRGPVFKALIAEAQADARFAEAFRISLMAAHRDVVRAIVGRAQLRDEVAVRHRRRPRRRHRLRPDPLPSSQRPRGARRDLRLQPRRRHRDDVEGLAGAGHAPRRRSRGVAFALDPASNALTKGAIGLSVRSLEIGFLDADLHFDRKEGRHKQRQRHR